MQYINFAWIYWVIINVNFLSCDNGIVIMKKNVFSLGDMLKYLGVQCYNIYGPLSYGSAKETCTYHMYVYTYVCMYRESRKTMWQNVNS